MKSLLGNRRIVVALMIAELLVQASVSVCAEAVPCLAAFSGIDSRPHVHLGAQHAVCNQAESDHPSDHQCQPADGLNSLAHGVIRGPASHDDDALYFSAQPWLGGKRSQDDRQSVGGRWDSAYPASCQYAFQAVRLSNLHARHVAATPPAQAAFFAGMSAGRLRV